MATLLKRFLLWIATRILCSIISMMSFKDMGAFLTVLADKVYKHRLGNRGYVPIEVFEQLLGPVTVSVQIVHLVLDEGRHDVGFALRLRDESEAGDMYQGKYHNTCTSLRWGDTVKTALARNDDDVFDDEFNEERPLKELGMTYHHERPRRNMDLTFMHQRRLWGDDMKKLKGTWKVFTFAELRAMVGKSPEELPIVESNLHQLLWVMDGSRSRFGVLKDTFPKELRT
jgi:hypothetical protein